MEQHTQQVKGGKVSFGSQCGEVSVHSQRALRQAGAAEGIAQHSLSIAGQVGSSKQQLPSFPPFAFHPDHKPLDGCHQSKANGASTIGAALNQFHDHTPLT